MEVSVQFSQQSGNHTMTVTSHLTIQVKPGMRAAAIEKFKQRRILEECAEAIPGLIDAKLMVPQTETDVFRVVANWTDAQDFQDWMEHPVRKAQSSDLEPFAAGAPESFLLESHHALTGKSHGGHSS